MSNKIAIFDGNKLYVWFDESSFENVCGLDILFDQGKNELNRHQEEMLSVYKEAPNIIFGLDQRQHPSQHTVTLKSMNSIIRRGPVSKELVHSLNCEITLSADGSKKVEHKGFTLYETKRGIKKVPIKATNRREVNIYVFSTLDNLQHGYVMKTANTYSPAQAIKKILRSLARDAQAAGDIATADRYYFHEKIHEIWFDSEGKLHHLTYGHSPTEEVVKSLTEEET